MFCNNRTLYAMLFIAFIVTVRSLFAATAGFNVLVVDADTLAPIKGVDVVGWFSNDNGWKAWTESAPEYVDKKTTDEKGFCYVAGETNTGETGVNIHYPPQGYYPSSFCIHHQFTQKPISPLMRWRPTDLVITALLQRVMHPLPLFVKRMGWCIGSDAIEKTEEPLRHVICSKDDVFLADWVFHRRRMMWYNMHCENGN